MNITCKGAFKFKTAAARESALASYEGDGYGVLAASDWKAAGAYAFIDRVVELDADMVGWRDSFEGVATGAQEGTVDLSSEDGSVRFTKAKGKKKVAVEEDPKDFGAPYDALVRTWSAAVEKVEKAEAKAKKKRGDDRAAALAASEKIALGKLDLGVYGTTMFVDADALLVLAGKKLVRVVNRAVVAAHDADYSSFTRLDNETFVLWATYMKSIGVLRNGTVSTIPLESDPHDVVFGNPGEIIVNDQRFIRRLSLDGKEIARIDFENQREMHVGQKRRGRSTKTFAAITTTAIAFAKPDDESVILIVDRNLQEIARLTTNGRVKSLAVQNDAFFALVDEGYSKSSLHPIEDGKLGEAIVSLDYEGRSASPIVVDGEQGWVLCGGFNTRFYLGDTIGLNHGFVASFCGTTRGGDAIIADISYSGQIDIYGLRSRYPRRVDIGTTLTGVVRVGDDLACWGYGSTLHRVRHDDTIDRIFGHGAAIRDAVALSDTELASLDEKGELRFWNLA